MTTVLNKCTFHPSPVSPRVVVGWVVGRRLSPLVPSQQDVSDLDTPLGKAINGSDAPGS